MKNLPITAALPDLITALSTKGRAVLQAPPGAGKTTRVPLAILKAGLTKGRIIMLEPRRLAARAAAERMAASLGQEVEQTVGYRIRGEARVSKTTRIEVVTEGILTRMLQTDPSLDGIGAVIFDEFHERSLNADLGLALSWEVRSALREDLMLVVMSATLDADPVAQMMDNAPVITSQGRSFPVETRWLPRPLGDMRLEPAVANLVTQAYSETEGGILVFLPGEGEIRRTQALLKDRLPKDAQLHTLFGAMDFKAQRAAIRPAQSGRKVVLATSIAETSLTIEDIRIVVDAGRSRRARFDPASGMSRLITERVTRAEAEQRRGRAGRVAPGVCYRLWTKGEEGALAAFPPPEVEAGDLTGLALELALWGAGNDDDLAFLTPPNPATLAEARALLTDLGALTQAGRITDHGRKIAALPLHPRLAHMLITAGQDGTTLAALLAERDPIRGAPVDITLRLEAIADLRRYERDHPWQAHRGTIERIRHEVKRLARHAPDTEGYTSAEMAALAYPDRIGLRRKGDVPRYVLSGGKGAVLPEDDPLAQARLIVATDLDGNPREARIRQAIEIPEAALRKLFAQQIAWHDICEWSRRENKIQARRQERLGALVLDDRIWPDAPPEALAEAATEGVRALGLAALGWSDAAKRLRARVELVRQAGEDLPNFSDDGLLETLAVWLTPHLSKFRTAADLKAFDPLEALRLYLGWEGEQLINRLAPPSYETPLGRKAPIDYSGEMPEITLRLQEMFGVIIHPTVGPKRTPIRITLLSPAGRPVQTTMDLPGFWSNSYEDVRKDMRGRYPKHPWPEDPTVAEPTLRAKRRK